MNKTKIAMICSLILHAGIGINFLISKKQVKNELVEISFSEPQPKASPVSQPIVSKKKPKPVAQQKIVKNQKYRFLSGNNDVCTAKKYSGIGLIIGPPSKDHGYLAIVATVLPGGPAEKAGIKTGDYVDSLNLGLNKLKKGDTLDLMYSSKGEIKFVTVVAQEICYSSEKIADNDHN